jgi:tRNA modification GTPase
MTVVIAGKPNAGKSSLLNCLAEKESAIVTEIAGTTRDVLRETIYIDGLPIHLTDTAGLRESHDLVEQEGIRRAKSELKKADLIFYMIDALEFADLTNQEIALIENLETKIPIVFIKNKIDLMSETPGKIESEGKTILKISAKHQLGLNELKDFLKEFSGYQTHQENTFLARQRHLDALLRVQNTLQKAEQHLTTQRAYEFLAEDLRISQEYLAEITGEFTSDDLLGRIFSSFCIGK